MSDLQKVMIAGVGGASLGTELLKCLSLAGGYEVYGCDISATAYGLYESGFKKTFHVSREHYIADVIEACKDSGSTWLLPGGEQPMVLLGAAAKQLEGAGIHLLSNSPEVIASFSDKDETFKLLSQANIPIPKTRAIESAHDVEGVGLPCIVKPATGSGGSASVFFAVSTDEAMVYADFIRRSGSVPLAQEYIDDDGGEFTVGVLTLPSGKTVGSIALRRAMDAKLSVAYRGRGGLISSGYSQGYIDEFADVCRQAEAIAEAVSSRGPINIQGRIKDGVFIPFEINPRFSASTYLRAMAGFNEVDLFIKSISTGAPAHQPKITPGWYLRSLTERFVPVENLK